MRNTVADNSPENLSDVLGRLFAARGWGRLSERTHLEQAWAKVVPPEVLGRTRVLALRRGVLEIQVSDGILLAELAGFQKRTLIGLLRDALSSQTITDIRFRRNG